MISIYRNELNDRPARKGAAAITILVLLGLMFVALVFCVDVARMQLAELEHQCASDTATRAGAEAMSRAVGSANDLAAFESNIENEIIMIASLNSAGGEPVTVDPDDISFGNAVADAQGAFSFNPTGGPTPGTLDTLSNSINVASSLNSFPIVFGGFVGTDSVDLGSNSSAMVQDRDIVLVLDRTSSMMRRDAGSVNVSSYPANLKITEDLLYGPNDPRHDGPTKFTEFEQVGSVYNLTRMQALKMAVQSFIKEIESSRGHESVGIVTYGAVADSPQDAIDAGQVSDGAPYDIESPGFFSGDLATASEAFKRIVGVSPAIQIDDSPVTFGDGASADGKTEIGDHEKYASALESHSTGYPNFKHTFAAMRYIERTNIGAGIQVGADALFGTGRRSSAAPILIVMTDGGQNTGPPALNVTNSLMANPAYRGMRVFTVSFGAPGGSSVDAGLMAAVAQAGRGEHYHASDVTELVATFRDLARNAGVVLIE